MIGLASRQENGRLIRYASAIALNLGSYADPAAQRANERALVKESERALVVAVDASAHGHAYSARDDVDVGCAID